MKKYNAPEMRTVSLKNEKLLTDSKVKSVRMVEEGTGVMLSKQGSVTSFGIPL